MEFADACVPKGSDPIDLSSTKLKKNVVKVFDSSGLGFDYGS